MRRECMPGFRFNNGRLMIFSEEEVNLIHSWPDLQAVRKPAAGKSWEPFVPCFRMLRPRGRNHADFGEHLGPCEVVSKALDPAWEKELAFTNFKRAIPPEIALAVAPFTNRQWALLRLCHRREQVHELLGQNPALGFGLAHLGKFRNHVTGPLERAAALSREKQRNIAWRLGFPRSQAWASILGKIPAEAITLDRLLALRARAADPALEKSLCHLSIINVGIIDLMTEPELARFASPSLLCEMAQAPEERLDTEVLLLLKGIYLLTDGQCAAGRTGAFLSIAEVRRRYQEAFDDYERSLKAMDESGPFSAPPLPGTESIVPLTSPSQLYEEGCQQHNCVGSYSDKVRSGSIYIYKVSAPERATLTIGKGPDGCWEIRELFLSCNRSANAKTWKAVEEWLGRYSLSV